MDHEEFEQVVRQVVARLPDWVREAFHNIEILVMDQPTPDLDPDDEGLLGLYVGTPLPERGMDYAWVLPDVIYIFRLPHLAMELPDSGLREEIARTVMHEIAHYFGIDDDYLDEIGWG